MLHSVPYSYIRADSSQESTLTIPVGNVTGNTELTYEFGVRRNFNFSCSPQDGTCSWMHESSLILLCSSIASSFHHLHGLEMILICPMNESPLMKLFSGYMSFIYHIGIPENRDTTPSLVINGKPHLPFQLHIRYTDPDGSRHMRVSTMAKPITADKRNADRGESFYK